MTPRQKLCQEFEVLPVLTSHTSITPCFHPDKNA